MKEKKLIELINKLQKLDETQLKIVSGAVDSCVLVQNLTNHQCNENVINLLKAVC